MKNILRVFLLLTFLIPSAAFSAVDVQLVVLPTSEYCRQIEAAFQNLKIKYGLKIDVKVSFLVQEDSRGRFYSPLGQNDFRELLRQAAIRKNRPDKLWPYISCRNSEMYNPIWEHSAQWAGIAPEKMDLWIKNDAPEKLLAQDRRLAKRHNLRQAPAVMINGEMIFEGEIGLPEIDAAISQCLAGKKSKVYSARIIHDPQATQPRLEGVKGYFQKYIVGIHFDSVPLTPELCRDLLQAGITALPAVLMDEKFGRTYYANYFTPGPEKTFQSRQYLPTPLYTDTLLDRESMPGRLRVIMQAYCPASVDLLRQLLEKSKRREVQDKLEFPYFLYELKAEKTGTSPANAIHPLADQGGFSALHGEQELAETARQLAIQKLAPDKYWAYLEHLYRLGFDLWEEALTQAGIRKVEIEQYLGGGKERCLRENYEIVKSLPITQSPVLLSGNRYLVLDINDYFNGKIKIEGSCGTAREE